jgi:AcrR family transcriptional regulator
MRQPSSDIRSTRRQQIVDAAVAVITEQGIQNLSLSEIEQRAGMSRGQLTYYFKSKEDILLGVFDHLVQLIEERVGAPEGATSPDGCDAGAWDWVRHLLGKLLVAPPISPEFSCLQYTFLAQMGHRDDFRQRLAGLYELWRGQMAEGLAEERSHNPHTPAVSSRALASLIQGMLHGLAMQRAVDPDAFDPAEMLQLCLDMLGSYLRIPPRRRTPPAAHTSVPTNGSSPRKRTRHLPRSREREL